MINATRQKLLVLAVLGLGGGLIVGGWRLDGEAYLSSFMLEIGVTVLLVLPLLWIERMFERRVEASEARTREQVGSVADEVSAVAGRLTQTQQGLADLRDQVSERLKADARADVQLVKDARADVSFEALALLFRRAGQLGALSKYGLRVPLKGQWERLRFRLVSGEESRQMFELAIEGPAGDDIGVRAVWLPGQTAVDVLATLVEEWRRNGSYPGDHAMDAEWMFGRLLVGLETVIQGRSERGEGQLHPLVEMASGAWAMTDFGLENIRGIDYAIPAKELVEDHDLTHWRRHMQDKLWVREQDEAARRAGDADFWIVTQVAHRFFAARTAEADEDKK
jgi:hypothetical protein